MARYETTDDQPEVVNKPKMVKETLAAEIKYLRQKLRGKFPSEIPRDPDEAALWWMTHQKPANDRTERPRQVAVTAKNAVRWINPYADRLIASLRRYARLSRQQREFILAAQDDGVWYNGDRFEFFQRVYDEHMKMLRVGLDQYRREAKGRLRAFVGGAS